MTVMWEVTPSPGCVKPRGCQYAFVAYFGTLKLDGGDTVFARGLGEGSEQRRDRSGRKRSADSRRTHT